jgi:two-component system, NtrC family, response regulator AtoC
MSANVLVIEDEAVLARNIKRFLELRGHDVTIAGTLAEAQAAYAASRPDVALIDYNLPDGKGLSFIRGVRALDRGTKLAMITAVATIQTAVEAMKAGADDYLTKPVSLDEIGLLVDGLVERLRLERSLSYYTSRDANRSGVDRIIGESPPMLELKQRIQQLLAMEERLQEGAPPSVLILGETGTGKELVARAIHFDGPRRARAFVEVNCAALPEHLVESELFGHERGAFTDARERKQGLVQAADGGTLFLDELGELGPGAQAKLLKVIEERRVRPLGSVRDHKVDIRIIAATNVALDEKVRSGEFREDLFFRLRVVSLTTPPLRERGEDVIRLAEHLLDDLRRRYVRPELRLGAQAHEALLAHRWPGNVRELRNVIEEATLLTIGDTIAAADLSLREPAPLQAMGSASAGAATAATLSTVERELIVRALGTHKGNVTLAASELGISRDTLRYRMDRHGLRRSDFT